MKSFILILTFVCSTFSICDEWVVKSNFKYRLCSYNLDTPLEEHSTIVYFENLKKTPIKLLVSTIWIKGCNEYKTDYTISLTQNDSLQLTTTMFKNFEVRQIN